VRRQTAAAKKWALRTGGAFAHELGRKQSAVMTQPRAISIAVDVKRRVSGLLQLPHAARVCFVLAHGAGAGMSHPFMAAVADGLAERDIATLRYQFPYMEEGSRRPDNAKVAQATVRAAVGEALRLVPELALVAGGKSFGGRMTSQAQAASLLPGVQGLVFLGFPLHPAGRPTDERGAHLVEIKVPMLFLQGTRDALAATELVEALVQRLGGRATLKLFQDANHSFHVPARTGGNDAEVRAEMLDNLSGWLKAVVPRPFAESRG
jgi:predicted alpha/beta-hydrolase family hydrolase